MKRKEKAITLRALSGVLAALMIFGGASTAAAAGEKSVDGLWKTAPRKGGAYLEILIGPCEFDPIRRCGTIAAARKGADPGYEGNPIIEGMQETAPGHWEKGEIIRPGSGKRFSSSLEVAGDELIVKGCAVAGIFCGESIWGRLD